MIGSSPPPRQGLHEGQPVLQAGEPRETARAALILVHGRGASASDILSLSNELTLPGWIFLAPQSAGYSWYPNRFMAPLESNEPWLSSALAVIGGLLENLAKDGIDPDRVGLLGFSQGACLALEFAARHPRRYAGVAGLSGGLIGPQPGEYTGSLAGTPVFLGCSDIDPHIPRERVEQTAQILEKLGGQVDMRLYPGLGHLVNQDELQSVQAMFSIPISPPNN